MRKWAVLAGLLVCFVVGDLFGGRVARRYDLPNMGELAVEFVTFAVVAAVAFWRWLR